MGAEIGQWNEWNHDRSLDWHLLDYPLHAGVQHWVADLNRLYRDEPALHELDFDPAGFSWIDANDADQSAISLVRRGRSTNDLVLAAFNFTPVPRHGYRVGVPRGGEWREVLNSDAQEYGGSGIGNQGGFQADPIPWSGQPYSLELTLPPLGGLFFKSAGEEEGTASVDESP
jgi:1,4-alpha-glucan branching enzyme